MQVVQEYRRFCCVDTMVMANIQKVLKFCVSGLQAALVHATYGIVNLVLRSLLQSFASLNKLALLNDRTQGKRLMIIFSVNCWCTASESQINEIFTHGVVH